MPLSKLADLVFCPRRAALHIVEHIWQENVFTAEGHNIHDNVHQADSESRNDLKIVRSLRLVSYRLGLSGVADVVEFQRSETGIRLAGSNGLWRVFPVEYKRGILKHDTSFEVQLCAQTICLEEMLNCAIEIGAIYYGKSRRRRDVAFTQALRAMTEDAAQRLHELFESRMTPKAEYGKKCKSCSLLEVCMPEVTGIEKDIEHYLSKAKTIEPEPDLSNGAQ